MAIPSTNFSKPTTTSTNFSKPSQVSTGYIVVDTDTDILLLQTSDSLLLQDGSSNLLLGGSGEQNTVNFCRPFA